ncbi:hypothetical protein EB796_022863 [Bugula neritina]|uniref:Protein Asterix n=1 Tax=Bugula neritina TaxID=10212 RepID=A0A7J7IZJ3_BUGNE|nr:hypothetical protein EB796_022863 [Bugula neritina]
MCHNLCISNVLRQMFNSDQSNLQEELTSDYLNLLGMVFSLCGLMIKIKWCAWCAVYCALMGFAHSKNSDDGKQIFSSFVLSISAVAMSYMQNPTPLTPPWQ